MSESTDLTVIDIKPEQAPALFIPNGLDAYLEHIKSSVNEAPDLSTKKGRDRVASLAAQVSRSKTAVEKPGREYLKRLKEAVKPAEQEIKRFVDACDVLRDETRRPLTEWEAEQECLRIEAEELAASEALKKQFESDHEIALLLNEKFDRDVAEKKAEAERQRIAYEEELKRQAVEHARQEAEASAQREREAAAKREADLQAAKDKAEADAKAAQVRAELEAKEAQERTAKLAQEAREQAERDKQQAIEAEQLKAQQEADRIKREADQKEAARLVEENRIADEAAKRAADVEHRKTVNNKALADLVAAGVPEECAIACIKAIAKGEVTAIRITY